MLRAKPSWLRPATYWKRPQRAILPLYCHLGLHWRRRKRGRFKGKYDYVRTASMRHMKSLLLLLINPIFQKSLPCEDSPQQPATCMLDWTASEAMCKRLVRFMSCLVHGVLSPQPKHTKIYPITESLLSALKLSLDIFHHLLLTHSTLPSIKFPGTLYSHSWGICGTVQISSPLTNIFPTTCRWVSVFCQLLLISDLPPKNVISAIVLTGTLDLEDLHLFFMLVSF